MKKNTFIASALLALSVAAGCKQTPTTGQKFKVAKDGCLELVDEEAKSKQLSLMNGFDSNGKDCGCVMAIAVLNDGTMLDLDAFNLNRLSSNNTLEYSPFK